VPDAILSEEKFTTASFGIKISQIRLPSDGAQYLRQQSPLDLVPRQKQMRSWHKLALFGTLALILLVSLVSSQDDSFDDEDEEPFFKNVRDRKLVSSTPSFRSIVKEHMHHGSETMSRTFKGPTLGYVTPWCVNCSVLAFNGIFPPLTLLSAFSGTPKDMMWPLNSIASSIW